MAGFIADLLADPIAWVFVLGGAAVIWQSSIWGAVALVIGWLFILGAASTLSRYRCNQCQAIYPRLPT